MTLAVCLLILLSALAVLVSALLYLTPRIYFDERRWQRLRRSLGARGRRITNQRNCGWPVCGCDPKARDCERS